MTEEEKKEKRSTDYKKDKELGKLGEKKFQFWLDSVQIPFLLVNQEQNHVSKGLKRVFEAKSPDFLLFVKHIGAVLIDVKNRKIENNEFEAKCNDISQLNNLEKNFNFKVWVVVPKRETDYKEWCWFHVGYLFETYREELEKKKSIQIKFEPNFTTNLEDDMNTLISKIQKF